MKHSHMTQQKQVEKIRLSFQVLPLLFCIRRDHNFNLLEIHIKCCEDNHSS
jgi:hypothetical protein